jgi:GTP:adenosylcobinamide-phosphate guanylyltransferase
MNIAQRVYPIALAGLLASTVVIASDLTALQTKELTVFAARAMGANVGVADIKNVSSRKEVEQMVTAGLNINGLLCAEITDIRPLKVRSAYEVTCVAYRNGSAKKAYIVDALKGSAYEP